MKNHLLLILSFLSFTASAQVTFSEAIGGPLTDQAISAEVTADGGYVVVGWTLSYGAGGWDIYLVKTSSTGAVQWTKTYGGPGEEVDCYVHQTFDGGYIITARTTSFNVASADVFLIKTDATGDVEWTKTIGGNTWDEGHSVIQTPDSGFVHVGFTTSFGAGDDDFYLMKNDKNGSVLWTKSFGGSGVENGHLIISALNGGYIILGETTSYGAGGYDYYLVKTDVNGNLEWSKTYGGSGDDHGWDIKATNDSCYILAGYTNSFGAGSNDFYLIKINSTGDVLWSKTYGNASDDIGLAIRQTDDHGYIITGETSLTGTDSADVYLIKTDSDGTLQWSRTFGGQGDDGSQSVVQTADRGYFISGYTNSFGQGDWDFYLIKTDSDGHTASCNLSDPVTLVANVTTSVLTSNPPTQTFSGASITSPSIIAGSGGTGTYCTLVSSIPNIESNGDYNLYPNPANDLLEVTHPPHILSIEIFNQSGQQVINRTVEHGGAREVFDISKLRAGIYTIRFISTDGITMKKFAKD